jgi:hypothetical protein
MRTVNWPAVLATFFIVVAAGIAVFDPSSSLAALVLCGGAVVSAVLSLHLSLDQRDE